MDLSSQKDKEYLKQEVITIDPVFFFVLHFVFIADIHHVLRSSVYFSSMAVACRAQQAPLAEMVILEATVSQGRRASLAAMASKARKASASTRSLRSPGGPTTSSVPGTH